MKLISNSYQHEINSSHLKMARVPSSVKLAFGKDPSGKPSCFPLISVHNINKSGLPQSRKNQKKKHFFKVRDDCVNELHIYIYHFMEIQNSTWKSIKSWVTLLFVEPSGF